MTRFLMPVVYCLLALQTLSPAMSLGQITTSRSTDPADFARIVELPLHGKELPISGPTVGVDNQSTIRIHFDATRMALRRSLREGGDTHPAVNIRIEAYSI